MTRRILVIDDEEGVRDAFVLALRGEQTLTVETANNGGAGLGAARAARPDLIFLDLHMPDMNGVDTMRELLATDPTLSVYIVTAFHQEFMLDLKAARAEGLRFELTRKPLGADQIRAIVHALLPDGEDTDAEERR